MRSQGVELRVRHLSEQLRSKDAEVAALRSQIGLLTSDFKYNLKLLKERDWELDQNEHQMKEMLKKIAEKEKEHKQLLGEIAKNKESAERDRGCIVELKETLGQYQDAVHTVRQRLEEARQMRDQELSHHQSERDLLQGKLQKQGEELRAEIEVARKEAAAACERKWSKLLHECNQSVASLVSEKGTLLLQKRQLEKDLEGLREQVKQLQQTVADLSSVTGESRKECIVLRDQLEILKVEIHCKVEELENERQRIGELEHERERNATRIAGLEHERCHIEDSIRQRLTTEHESAVRDLYSQLQYAEHKRVTEQNEAEARSIEENAKHMRELEKLRNDAENEAIHYAKEVERLHEDAQSHSAIYAQELEKLKQDAQNQATSFAREIALLREVNLCACQARAQSYEPEQRGPQVAATRREKFVDTGQPQCKGPLNYRTIPGQRSVIGAENAGFHDQISTGGRCSGETSEVGEEDGYGSDLIGDLNISPMEASNRFANDTDHYRVRMVLEAENKFLRENLKELQHQNETVGKIIFDLRHELETAGLLKPSKNWESGDSGKGGQIQKDTSPSAQDVSPVHSSPKRQPLINTLGLANPASSPRKEPYKEEPPLSLADREELQLLRSYYAEMSADSDHLEYCHGKPPASASSSVMAKHKRASFTPELSLSQRLKLFSPNIGHQVFHDSRDTTELSNGQQQTTPSPGAGHHRLTMSRESLQDKERLIERRFQDSRKKSDKNLGDYQDRAGSTITPVLGRHSSWRMIKTGGHMYKQSSPSESEDDSCFGNMEEDSGSSVDGTSPDASRPHKVYRRMPGADPGAKVARKFKYET